MCIFQKPERSQIRAFYYQKQESSTGSKRRLEIEMEKPGGLKAQNNWGSFELQSSEKLVARKTN